MQKEIWLTDLEPVEGSKQGGKRPVVIVSGETQNEYYPVIIICPLTSKIKHFETGVVIHKNKENGLAVDSEVLTFHIRTISKQQLIKKIGSVSDGDMNLIILRINDNFNY